MNYVINKLKSMILIIAISLFIFQN